MYIKCMRVCCKVVGCLEIKYAKGLCTKHYQRQRNTGSTGDPVSRARPAEERFWEKVQRGSPEECWLWTAGIRPDGYAQFRPHHGAKVSLCHRFAYANLVGSVPPGLYLDHLCGIRHCVNPAHLEPVTIRENTLRSKIAPAAINARKTHCPKGHGYTQENTIKRGNRRWCRTCERARKQS